MVVAEVLTGLALVRSGVSFIKENINTAKDIGEMADAIDNLFDGRDQAHAAKRKANKTHSHKSVAHEVIDAKLQSPHVLLICCLLYTSPSPRDAS